MVDADSNKNDGSIKEEISEEKENKNLLRNLLRNGQIQYHNFLFKYVTDWQYLFYVNMSNKTNFK